MERASPEKHKVTGEMVGRAGRDSTNHEEVRAVCWCDNLQRDKNDIDKPSDAEKPSRAQLGQTDP